ncbi:hypothetical protein BC833DRAFT_624376 [Globomyces pollinis-pini]|nr:hypothetical protein BC833DRAFT_624376 [Globomyces pollinis-pini]
MKIFQSLIHHHSFKNLFRTGSITNKYLGKSSSNSLSKFSSGSTLFSHYRNSSRFSLNRFKGNNKPSILQSWKRAQSNRDPSKSIIYGIIGINSLILLGWQIADNWHFTYRDESLLKFMFENFTLGDHSYTHPHSFILAHLSHRSVIHFGINMFVLYSFGFSLISVMGAQSFLSLYIVSGLASGVASMLYKEYAYPSGYRVPPSLGASGCISGVVGTFATMFPFATVQVIFFPVPAWLAVGGFAMYDLFRCIKQSQHRIDSAGHLGGLVGGILFHLLRLRR